MKASGNGGEKRRLKPLSTCNSKVWKYFGLPVNDAGVITDKKEVYYMFCHHRLLYSGNTTNLFNHLEANTKASLAKLPPKKKMVKEISEGTPGQNISPSSLTPKLATLNTWFDNSKQYAHHSSRYQHCEDAVIEFVCKNL